MRTRVELRYGLHARVTNGRLVVEEPTDLPEGVVVELVTLDEAMDAKERAALVASIERGLAQVDRGEGVPAEEALKRLRASK